MKVVWVVAGALITPDFKVLLSRRPEGKNLAGFWEYPGGKIELDETPQDALCRELKEELNITVVPEHLEPLTFASFGYKTFHLVMPLFVCQSWQGIPVGAEGQKIDFVDAENAGLEPDKYPMPPADDDLSDCLRLWVKRHKKKEAV